MQNADPTLSWIPNCMESISVPPLHHVTTKLFITYVGVI